MIRLLWKCLFFLGLFHPGNSWHRRRCDGDRISFLAHNGQVVVIVKDTAALDSRIKLPIQSSNCHKKVGRLPGFLIFRGGEQEIKTDITETTTLLLQDEKQDSGHHSPPLMIFDDDEKSSFLHENADNLKDYSIVAVLRPHYFIDPFVDSNITNQNTFKVEIFLIPRLRQEEQEEGTKRKDNNTTDIILAIPWFSTALSSSFVDLDVALETVAWISNLVVLPLSVGQSLWVASSSNNPNTTTTTSVLQLLQKGFQRRQHPSNKGHFLMLLNNPTTNLLNNNETNSDYWHKWHSDLIHNHLSFLDPATSDIITPHEANDTFTLHSLQKRLYASKDQIDLPITGFPLLLQEMYQSLAEQKMDHADHHNNTNTQNSKKIISSSQSQFSFQSGTMMRTSKQPLLFLDSEPSLLNTFNSTKIDSRHDKGVAKPVVEISSIVVDSDYDKEQDILDWALDQLTEIQTRLEESWLRDDNNLDDNVFGTLATALLDDLFVKLQSISSKLDRANVAERLAEPLRNRYQQYLQYCRNRLGTRFEQILDQGTGDPTDAGRQISNQFRQWAQLAIPILAQPGGVFRDMDLEYVSVLEGLNRDMQSAMELRSFNQSFLLFEEEAEEDDKTQQKWSSLLQGVKTKWYYKLGARLITLGVNYLQGWLVWQGIQRAALERERIFPKFPIF